jgi:hypothetical protein
MYTLKLNRELLGWLILFKAMQKMLLAQGMYGQHMTERMGRPAPSALGTNWYEQIKKWFYDQPQEEMDELGIHLNDLTFTTLINMQIPDEWTSTLFSELDQFQVKF